MNHTLQNNMGCNQQKQICSINKHLVIDEYEEFPWLFVNKDEQSGVNMGEHDSGTRSVDNQQFEERMWKKQQWGHGVGQEHSWIDVREEKQSELMLEQMNDR